MIAVNRYGIDVDDILNRFECEISNIHDHGEIQTMTSKILIISLLAY